MQGVETQMPLDSFHRWGAVPVDVRQNFSLSQKPLQSDLKTNASIAQETIEKMHMCEVLLSRTRPSTAKLSTSYHKAEK